MNGENLLSKKVAALEAKLRKVKYQRDEWRLKATNYPKLEQAKKDRDEWKRKALQYQQRVLELQAELKEKR